MDNDHLLTIWYAALGFEYGLRIRVTNGTANQARLKLGKLRRDIGDPALNTLTILTDPDNPDQYLWIAPRYILMETPTDAEEPS